MLTESMRALIAGELHELGYFNDDIGCSFQGWRIPYSECPLENFEATENHYWIPIKHLYREISPLKRDLP